MNTRSLAVGTRESALWSLSRPFFVGFTLVAIPYFSCKKSPTTEKDVVDTDLLVPFLVSGVAGFVEALYLTMVCSKLCVVQAANTNSMAGIPLFVLFKGNAAHQRAFHLPKAKTIGPRVLRSYDI